MSATAISEAQRRRATSPRLVTHKTLVYRVVRRLVWLWFVVLHRVRFEGIGNLPIEGGILIVANHQSFLDIPLIAASTGRHVCFVARETLARSRPIAFLLRHTGAVLIRRDAADRTALEGMVEHLRRGDCVAVFPEGTRTRDGRPGEFRRGGLVAARRAGVAVVPCGIRGNFEILPRGARFPRPRRCAVRYALPIRPEEPHAMERVRAAVLEMVGDGSLRAVPPG